jgi:hypothetical protein
MRLSEQLRDGFVGGLGGGLLLLVLRAATVLGTLLAHYTIKNIDLNAEKHWSTVDTHNQLTLLSTSWRGAVEFIS